MTLLWPLEGIVLVAANLVVGGAALYAATRVVYSDRERNSLGLGLEHGVVTALLGAVVWAVLGIVPVVGTLLALAGWIAVLHVRYPGDWLVSTGVGVGAWAAAVLALAALELVGIGAFSALGVPGA